MSGQVEVIIVGPGVEQITDEQLQLVEEWAQSKHYESYEYGPIFGADGPYADCLDCEWSANLSNEVYA